MNKKEITFKLHCILMEITEEDEFDFDSDRELINGYGLDSMGYLSLTVQIQRSFGVVITTEEWPEIKTIKDLVNVVISKMNCSDD